MEMSEKKPSFTPGLISVLMANYNTRDRYLRSAIESVLRQSYTNFEFIIVDDGSSDDSVAIIKSYQDERIVFIRNKTNIGLIASLNKGLDYCHGEFIARVDADDICLRDRFKTQIEFMQAHPEVIVSGTWIMNIGDWREREKSRVVNEQITSREDYRICLLFANKPMIYHPSAMLNHRLMKQYGLRYEDDKLYAEDYKLWVSCAEVADCVIIPQVLVKYRLHEKAITAVHKQRTRRTYHLIVQNQLDKLHLTLSWEELPAYRKLQYNKQPYDLKSREWVTKLIKANRLYHVYDQRLLKKSLWERWTRITYFGLLNNRSFWERLRMLAMLPLYKYPRLIHFIVDKRYKSLKKTLKSLRA